MTPTPEQLKEAEKIVKEACQDHNEGHGDLLVLMEKSVAQALAQERQRTWERALEIHKESCCGGGITSEGEEDGPCGCCENSGDALIAAAKEDGVELEKIKSEV